MEQQNQQQIRVREQSALVRRLAPEDVAPGQYVTVLRVVEERWPSSFCEDSAAWLRGPVRHEASPWYAGLPLRVVGVCLPFVLAQRADGRHWTLDVRRHALARLSNRYGCEAFKRYACDAARESSEGEDGDDD